MPSETSLTTALPLLLGGGDGGNRSGVFTLATLGLSCTLLRFIVTAMQDSNGNKRRIHNNDYDAGNEMVHRSQMVYQFVRSFLRRLLLQEANGRQLSDGGSDVDDDEDTAPILHEGSCHCRSVCFELIAPRRVLYKEGLPGKIQYRHTRIRARSFRFTKGTHLVNMYYVQKKQPQSPQKMWQKSSGSGHNDEIGAHSFCSRCGVQILHAPNSHSTALDVNIECLYTGEAKFQLMTSAGKVPKQVDLSAGTFVIGQWDETDQGVSSKHYPATIAEEFPERMTPFGAYKQHPLLRPQADFDTLDDYYDDDASNAMLASIPGTPSTVQTSQTGSLVSSYRGNNGVPPTLTVDTRDGGGDADDSVVSFASSRSCFPSIASAPATFKTLSSAHSLPPVPLDSPDGDPMKTAVTPSTTALVRHQMKHYMRKHMSSSTTPVSSSSKTNSPLSAFKGSPKNQ